MSQILFTLWMPENVLFDIFFTSFAEGDLTPRYRPTPHAPHSGPLFVERYALGDSCFVDGIKPVCLHP